MYGCLDALCCELAFTCGVNCIWKIGHFCLLLKHFLRKLKDFCLIKSGTYLGLMDNKKNIFALNQRCFWKNTVITRLRLLNEQNLKQISKSSWYRRMKTLSKFSSCKDTINNTILNILLIFFNNVIETLKRK